jgi:hypothetical protein
MLVATFLTHRIQIRSPVLRWKLRRKRRFLDHRMEQLAQRNERLQTFQLSNKRFTICPGIFRLSTTNKKNYACAGHGMFIPASPSISCCSTTREILVKAEPYK